MLLHPFYYRLLLSLPSPLTHFSLHKLVQAPASSPCGGWEPWDQAETQTAWGAVFGGRKQRGQGSLKWQAILCLALLTMLIHASVSGVETRRTGTAPFDIHLNPNSGPSGTLSLISHGTLTAIFHSTGLQSAELQAHTRSGNCSLFHTHLLVSSSLCCYSHIVHSICSQSYHLCHSDCAFPGIASLL